MKAMTLRLSDEVHETLRQEAFDTREPITEIIRRAIEVHAGLRQRHQRQGRPHISECTCGTILCPELAMLEGRAEASNYASASRGPRIDSCSSGPMSKRAGQCEATATLDNGVVSIPVQCILEAGHEGADHVARVTWSDVVVIHGDG